MALTVPLSEIVAKSSNRLLGKHKSWGRVLLGEVATVLNGFAFKSSEFSNSGGLPLIRIRNVGKDRSETTYLGEYDPRYVVEPGDLLVGMDGDFNCAQWRGPRGLLNQRVCKITLKSDIYLAKFLDHTLPGYLKAINDVTSSVTVKHLSSKSIEEIPLPLPPKEVQQILVAEIEKQFSRLDEAVANVRRVKANLKRYKAAVEGLLAPLEADNAHSAGTRFNLSAVELEVIREANSPQRVRRSVPDEVPLSRVAESLAVPQGWSLNSVAELLHVSALRDVKDGNHGANHPRSEEFTDKGLPFITATEVNNFRIDYEKSAKVSGQPLSKLKVGFAEPGDVILTHKGTVGRVAINDRPCVLSPQTTYYRLSDTAFDRRYLQYFFASPQFYGQLADVKSQTTRDYVPISDQYRLFVLRPPFREQSRIVAEVERRLSVIEELEATVEANLTRADRLRKSVLGDAFFGKLVRATV